MTRRGFRPDNALWVLAAALAVLGAVVLLMPDGPDRGTVRTSSNAMHSNPSSASAHDPRPEPRWMPVVEGFAADFTAGGDVDAWARRLSRWVTPHLASAYTQTADWRRPTGDLVAITPDAVGDAAVEALVEYDTGLVVRVRVEYGPPGWQVTSAHPV